MKIEKLNHQGHGIGYQDQKITFVAKALPGDDVEIKITKTDKKINEAVILKINEPSPKRIAALCPHFNKCGGCDLLNLTYEDTLAFKKQNVKEILLKYANLEVDPEIIASPSPLNYRNKITLKIKQGNPGYYEEKLVDKEIPADLKPLINYLPARSVWTIGGDGWAYDIGFGGIDHVLSSGIKSKT